MKKTLTINLNSTVFNIDEDAYEKLQGYLNELRLHLEKDERDEVMQDIEARVGELFGEEIGRYKSVISIEDVDKVIETLGSPDSFGPITEEKPTSSRSRKFYRSADNHVLGGVAAGVAALLGWDAVWIRLIFILLLCASFGWMTLVYIIMWIILPEARTVAQKLEMQGIEPSAQNISDYSRNNVQAEPARGNDVMRTLVKIIGVLALLPVIFVLLVIVFAIIFGCIGALSASVPNLLGITSMQLNWWLIVPLIISALAAVIIPLVFVIKLIARAVSHSHKATNRTAFVIWLIVWVVSVITTMLLLLDVARTGDYKQMKEVIMKEILEEYEDDPELVTEVRCEGMPFQSIDASKVEVYLMKDTIDMVEITAPTNTMRKVVVDVKDSVLTIDVAKNRCRHIKAIVHYTGELRDIKISAGAELKGRIAAGNELSLKSSAGSEISLDELTMTGKVDIKASSGSEVEIERVDVREMTLGISSGAEAEIGGKTGKMTIEGSSGASVDIEDLRVDTLQMSMSSGANVKRPKIKYFEIKK